MSEHLTKRESDALVGELLEKMDAIAIEIDEDRKQEVFWRCIIGLVTFVLGVLVGTLAP